MIMVSDAKISLADRHSRIQLSSIHMHRNSYTLIQCGPEYIFSWLPDENTSCVRIYCFLCIPKAYTSLTEATGCAHLSKLRCQVLGFFGK